MGQDTGAVVYSNVQEGGNANHQVISPRGGCDCMKDNRARGSQVEDAAAIAHECFEGTSAACDADDVNAGANGLIRILTPYSSILNTIFILPR